MLVSWNPLVGGRGLSGNKSRPSPTLLLGLDVGSANNPFLSASAIFFERPRRFSRLPVLSMVVALQNKQDATLLLTAGREVKGQVVNNPDLPATSGFAWLGVAIDHPPGTLAGALVLHPHKPAVQRQVVTYRIL